MKKLLTIIIPTYNMEKYLSRCLESLIIEDELLRNGLEVLVVNDGSRDSSSEIAHNYELRYPSTFRVIDKENGNYGSCINRGLKEAKGKYVKILDADDWFDKSNLSGFLEFTSNTDADIIVSAYDRVENDGKVISEYRFEQIKGGLQDISMLSQLDVNIEMHGIAFKTDLLKQNGYYQTIGISYTDTEWSFIPLAYCHSLIYYPNCIYKYVLGREGQTMSSQAINKNLWMMNKVFLNIATFYDKTIKKRGDLSNYWLNKLRVMGDGIYRLYILEYNKGRVGELIELDERLKIQSPIVYNHLNSCVVRPKLNYFYIKKFRQNNYQPTFILLAYGILKKFFQ